MMSETPTQPPRYMDLSRFAVPQGFRGRSAVMVQLWWLVQALLIHTSPQFMYGWRRFWWRAFGAKIGCGVLLRPSATATYPWKITIGDYAWIGDGVELYSLAPITIGANAVISQRSTLCAGSHDYTRLDFPLTAEPITVEDEAWIAAECFVAQGLTIGRGAIVGARSVVLESIPAATIWAGHTAKFITNRSAQQATPAAKLKN